MKLYIIGIFMTVTSIVANANAEKEVIFKPLPDYIIWNEKSDQTSIVRQKAVEMKFPLSDIDRKDIETLVNKYEAEKGCAGLAAPQIGISKRFIVFKVADSAELKKWRQDLVQTMPRSIWLNPSYEPLSDEMHEDFEGCYTVPDVAGYVKRYRKIKYSAYDVDGKVITGTAEGFLARVIQHEIDHLNGVLFIDRVDKEKLISMEEYKAMRKKALEDPEPQEQP